jgi:hypothetical protein
VRVSWRDCVVAFSLRDLHLDSDSNPSPQSPFQPPTAQRYQEYQHFPKEWILLSGTKGINHLASGCGINAEKSLVSP